MPFLGHFFSPPLKPGNREASGRGPGCDEGTGIGVWEGRGCL